MMKTKYLRYALLALILVNLTARAQENVADVLIPTYVPGTTEKVLQLTGDFDRERQEPTLNQTFSRYGLWGTDLGDPVEHKGRLYLFFGDAWITPPSARPGSTDWRWDRDPFAYTTSTDPADLRLEFPVDSDGKFRPVTIPSIEQGGFEVPGGGISLNDTIYLVFTTDARFDGYPVMGRSVVAKSVDDGLNWINLYDLSTSKFINVGMVEVAPDEESELPGDENVVLIWGSGEYRNSSPRLAYVPSSRIESPSAIRYFSGFNESGMPAWSSSEDEAIELFDHPVVGEFSVVRYEGFYLMMYNSFVPRGIAFRAAKKPWGPWSEAQFVFDPTEEGYEEFLHSPANPLPDGISLADPGREEEPGGEYAPYMLKRYFRVRRGREHTLYFVMSTWNPYNVVLMQADFQFP